MAAKRGALIVLEGMDRPRKSTQCQKLQEALRQRAKVLRLLARGSEISRLISSYLEKKNNLDGHSVHLFFAANRWERVSLIKEKLQQGVTLILDRYAFSGVAFTSAKPDFTLEWCIQPDIAMKRGGFGNEWNENLTFQELVLQQFEELMKDRSLDWKTLDASQSI
ncbi:thymidylate kinase-like isoform X1 [Cetorhinus maximus]